MKEYRNADVKYNNGNGALLCNRCSVIISYGFEHVDDYHFCKECYEEQRMQYLQDLLDSDEVKYALGTIADYAISKDLLRARDRMVNDYERAMAGIVTNVFVMGDAKKDAKKLKKYIKAYDLILDMYTVNHTFYDFNHED